MVLNTAVAESLRKYADILENADNFETSLHELIRSVIKKHKRIIFTTKRPRLSVRLTRSIGLVLNAESSALLMCMNVLKSSIWMRPFLCVEPTRIVQLFSKT